MSETSVNILMMDTFQTLIRRGLLAQCNHSPQGQWGPWVSLTAVGVTPPPLPPGPPPQAGSHFGAILGSVPGEAAEGLPGLVLHVGGSWVLRGGDMGGTA